MKSFGNIIICVGRMVAAVAILAGALASPSYALGTRDSTNGPPATSAAVHTYPFTLSVTSAIDYFTTGIDFPAQFSITSFVTTLFNGSALVSGMEGSPAGALLPNSFFLGSLAPGDQLRRGGLAAGTTAVDSYSRALRLTAPNATIRDPEIWTMSLVVVGLIAIRLRRKSRLDSARHFA